MKKTIVLLFILLLSFSLYAGVFELFYPNTSYYEMANLVKNNMIGAFSFDDKVEVSRDVEMMGENCYLYYDKGRQDTIFFHQAASELSLYTVTKAYLGHLLTRNVYTFPVLNIPYFSPEKRGEKIVSENYITEENSDRRIVFKANDKNVRIEMEEFDDWARKIVYLDERVLYCRWIINWKEIDGNRIPTTEAFYIPSLLGGSRIAFKETVATGGFESDYGTFTEESFRELFNRLK